MTIAAVLALYSEQHAPSTVDPTRIANCVEALVAWWGDRSCQTIRRETCERYARERKRAPGTIRRELGCLQAAGNHAVREGYLTRFPVVTLPAKPEPKQRWLSRREAAGLLREARREPKARLHLPLFILIALYTGARRSAVLGLRWTQNTEGGWVDLRHGVIDFSPVGRRQTKKRRARIPIPPRLAGFLRRARDRATTDHVLEYDGEAIASVKRSFARAVADAGLKDVSVHTLRHTCATWLMQAGVPPWEASGWLEMSVETLMKVYGHHHPDHLKGARDALGGRSATYPET